MIRMQNAIDQQLQQPLTEDYLILNKVPDIYLVLSAEWKKPSRILV